MNKSTFRPSAENRRLNVPDAMLRRDRICKASGQPPQNSATIVASPATMTTTAASGWERYIDSRLKQFSLR